MQEGQRYFLCEHDILRRDFRQKEVSETKDGKEELKKFYNPNRSNHKNVNPFHHTLVMQKAAYLVGREPTVTIKGHNEMFEKEVTDFCGETFNRLLYRWVVEASIVVCHICIFIMTQMVILRWILYQRKS